MIITCPSCKKKFEINVNLIPKEGRNLQCGSCSNVWFYKFKEDISEYKNQITTKDLINNEKNNEIKTDIKREISVNKKKIIDSKKDKALVKYEKKNKLSLSNLVGYFVVLILSFVALIIVLDTFQPLLSTIFPNLELILFNLYETLIDIYLFTKDLFK